MRINSYESYIAYFLSFPRYNEFFSPLLLCGATLCIARSMPLCDIRLSRSCIVSKQEDNSQSF